MLPRLAPIVLLALCAGCESISGIDDFSTVAPAKATDAGDGEAGGDDAQDETVQLDAPVE